MRSIHTYLKKIKTQMLCADKMSKTQRILLALMRGRKLSAMTSLREFNTMRLSARMHDLKTMYGIQWDCEYVGETNHAVYWISKDEQKRLKQIFDES